jgi:PAS domain S-box-containing protein
MELPGQFKRGVCLATMILKFKELSKKASFRYTCIGAGCGLVFPILAYQLEAWFSGNSLLHAFTTHPNPQLYIIDSAPFILALFSYAAGVKQDKISKLFQIKAELERNGAQLQLEEAERLGKYGSWEIDLQTLEVKWSKGFYFILGLDPKVHLASIEAYHRLVHPDYIDIVQRRIKSFYSNHVPGPFDKDIRIVCPDGKTKWLRGRGAVVTDQVTGARKAIGTSQDVTETVLAEEEARTYKNALDQSAIVAITDARGKIIYGNAAFAQISGYSLDELIGQDHRIVNSGRMGKSFFQEMWKTIISGKTWRGEICNRAKNGKEYWVYTTIVPSIDPNGKITQYTSIRYEISDRKRMEAELWATNEIRRTILESTNYGVIATDCDGIIHTFNRTAETMLGYKADEVIGKLTPAAFHDLGEVVIRTRSLSIELKRQIKPGFDTFCAKARLGISDENEWTYIRKDGRGVPVRLSVTALKDQNGSLVGFLGMAQDISEAKRNREQLLEANERAQTAARAKSAFLANMSHEIRTPMNGVIGMCNLLLDSVQDPSQAEGLKIIQQCGNSLLDLINDILDFSKLEVDKFEFENEPFNPHITAQEVVDLLNSLASQKGLLLSYNSSFSTPQWVLGDVTRFRQILMNLVSNAIKFTEHGSVHITSRVIPLGDHKYNLQFSVKDTGIGIPQESQARLFNSFSQVDASTTRKFGGTGLGLAISKGLCEKMGGRIWVESTVDQGSTFSFSLVVLESTDTSVNSKRETTLSEESNLGTRYPQQILVAEDNRTNQLVLVGLLEKLGYRPDVAENGREVLKMLKTKFYNLILMDCHMPEIDGFETTLRIRKNLKFSQIQIVAVTASTMKEDVERCLRVGMTAFLSKPITISSLVQTLKEAFIRFHENTATIMNDKEFLANLSGIEDLASITIQSFLAALPSMVEAIRKAITRRDAQALEISAHTLKSSVSYFYAEQVKNSACKLEQMGRSANLSKCQEVFDQLLKDLHHFKEHLKHLIQDKKAS